MPLYLIVTSLSFDGESSSNREPTQWRHVNVQVDSSAMQANSAIDRSMERHTERHKNRAGFLEQQNAIG
jgi:hypothetical protein